MFVRGYQMSDCKEITELFYNTVHTINAKDYTKEQLPETATVEKNGGEVIILSYVEGKSTTNIVNKIQFKNEKEDDEGGENE